jgi:hypothetical protein
MIIWKLSNYLVYVKSTYFKKGLLSDGYNPAHRTKQVEMSVFFQTSAHLDLFWFSLLTTVR